MRYLLFLLLGFGLYACGPSTPGFVKPPQVVNNPDSAAPFVAFLEFTADEPVRSLLEVTDGKKSWKLEPQSLYQQEVRMPIFQLQPNTDYRFSLTLKDTRKNLSPPIQDLLYHSPSLPADFPGLKVTLALAEKREPGFTLMSIVAKANPQGPGWLVALDQEGKVIWYTRHQEAFGVLKLSRGGRVVSMNEQGHIVELNWLGERVREFANWPVNEPVVPLSFILNAIGDIEANKGRSYLAFRSDTILADTLVPKQILEQMEDTDQAPLSVDVLVEFDADGKVLKEWPLINYFDPFRVRYWEKEGTQMIWNRFNGIFADKNQGTIYLSSTFQNLLAALDPDSEELLWILSDTLAWKDTTLKAKLLQANGAVQWPVKIQSSRLSAHQSLLVVDQGGAGTPGAGRVLEYVVDPYAKTVRQTWIYGNTKDESFYTGLHSSAERMPFTGNVLFSGATQISDSAKRTDLVREVTHIEERELVFEVILDSQYQLNGLLHLPDLKTKMEGE